MRYFVQFSYNGASYHGWQIQPNAITVQQVLESAFTKLLRLPIALVGAGRTDAGVHAKQMFAHFDTDAVINTIDLTYRLNALLPNAIAVQEIVEVNADAHARFTATERTYEYIVTQEKNPFYFDASHYVKKPLNIDKMNAAAALLLQYEDFECFSKSNTDVYTYLCAIKKAEWTVKEDCLVFTITANRFLRNMVRAIVGTLLEVGIGKRTIVDVEAVINGKDRTKAGASVPAKGLYLTKIKYPKSITLKHE